MIRRRTHRRPPLVAIVLAALSLGSPASADRIQQYSSMALQGDLTGAAALFEGADDLTANESDLAEKFRNRFLLRTEERPAVSQNGFVTDVFAIFEGYWTSVLMGDVNLEAGEAALLEQLGARLQQRDLAQPDKSPTGGGILDRMKIALEEEGFYLISGRTRPHLELMLWTDREVTQYKVELTDGTQPVDVVFIGGFLVRGWAHFATMGAASTGGWATSDSLFCLRDDYDLESERFRVSYLQHESRHFADYASYPELKQIDLEYRAKLTEFAFVETTFLRLVRHFASSASLNEAAPHSYANHAVIRDLSAELFGEEVASADDDRWAEVHMDQVHAAARRLLKRSDAELAAAGALTTEGVVATRE